MNSIDSIFSIVAPDHFLEISLEIFRYQYSTISVYQKFVNLVGVDPQKVTSLSEIPFLPIELFKAEPILNKTQILVSPFSIPIQNDLPEGYELVFSSSGTTGQIPSKHYVRSAQLYELSFYKGFELFYGDIGQYVLLALLPSYLEREGSSLVYMVQKLIEKGGNGESGFYIHNLEALKNTLFSLKNRNQKTILIGVTYALLDFLEKYPHFEFPDLIIMETGGMKGKRKEMIREELHFLLNQHFKTQSIHSEYGMTELLSQAYSLGEGLFKPPPWMKILIRDTSDPFLILDSGKTGGINVIDLANVYSCSFIATWDLGKIYENGSFEVLGRFDHSDIRGCNLLVE